MFGKESYIRRLIVVRNPRQTENWLLYASVSSSVTHPSKRRARVCVCVCVCACVRGGSNIMFHCIIYNKKPVYDVFKCE